VMSKQPRSKTLSTSHIWIMRRLLRLVWRWLRHRSSRGIKICRVDKSSSRKWSTSVELTPIVFLLISCVKLLQILRFT
jgi:hypothetical protein